MASGSSSSDREVLLLFKSRTSVEDFWTNRDGWNANATDLNSWFGVTAAANGHIVKLDLSTDFEPFIKEDVPRLAGIIPVELAQLSNLTHLQLSCNQLTGIIPVELAQLSNLTHLRLSWNKLTGIIPVELAQLSNLTHLNLEGNQLTGIIPVELAQLSNLTHLYLEGNQLTGIIPVELAQLSNLTDLRLSWNQLTGIIPVELAQLSSMTHLYLDSNQLTGIIPVELAQLSNLTHLRLSWNKLTGIIPVELAQLSSMTHLYLDSNQLTGIIPVELAQLSNLTHLNLEGNQLTGIIPVELAQLSSMTHLYLDSNQLTGIIPVELAQLSNMTDLNLEGNQLTGIIPVELAQLSKLTYLRLSVNKLTGIIPVELAQLSNLTHLYLEGNQLTGIIPVELAQLSNLTHLRLSWNKLTGIIPVELAQLSNLTYLRLSMNKLTGIIPVELAQLSNLTHLRLSWNKLTGIIPVELAQLSNMTHLYLDSIQLTGIIPVELAQLSNLTHLNLEGNQLTGIIPVELAQLSNLTDLYLDSNQLTGIIPVELAQLSNLTALNLEGNQLTGIIPVELAQLSNLTHLNLEGNQLTGIIPVELAQLSNLTALNLDSNQLTGIIPVELAQLSNMTYLILEGNQLTGIIPVELAQLSNLTDLYLGSNQLTGIIPVELAQLSNLTALNLDSNQLTGIIPVELAQLSNMTYLILEGNQLTGIIPVELAQLSNLTDLYLGSNQLTGIIPVELAQLSNLTALNLEGNQLTGFGDVEDALKLTTRFLSIDDVYLDDNPWRMPPEAVVEQGLEAVKTYLNDVKDAKDTGASTRSLQLLKVVLVGSSQAGKTSLINSIVDGRAAPTKGGPEEASTVGIELRPHDLGNTLVEFYDCAGQLDYAGMHQTFLSKRALYLLVWDVTTCQNLSTNSDVDEVIREKIIRWLTILHLRAPKATVMLVTNKCDGIIEEYSEIVDKVEKRARVLLDEWQSKRGLDGRDGQNITNWSWLPGRNLISCQDYTGVSELIQRISDFGSTLIEVPPSWELALTVVNGLRNDRAPLAIASEHLELSETPPETARKGTWTHTIITRQKLSREWKNVVRSVRTKLEARAPALTTICSNEENVHERERAALSNPESALLGALWISEFAGRILRFDGGEKIFLDVVWLSKVLSPILSHKLRHECPPSSTLSPLRDDLESKGILRVEFARYLWRDVLNSSTVEANDRIIKGLYRVLLELGVILPLGRTTLLGINLCIPRVQFESDVTPQDVLVVMRLPKTDDLVSEELREACEEDALEGAGEVMLKWRFDSAGAPEGFVERLIATCHRINEVEMQLCWRYGGFFKSSTKVQQDGRVLRLFTLMIRYDEVHAPGQSGSRDRVISVRAMGPLEDDKVWKALRYVASAMVILSEEWPGVLWQGWSQCPKHRNGIMYLAPPHEAKIGRPLLSATARSACDCSLEENSVQKLVLKRLGNVIDTKKGDPFPITPNTSASSHGTTGGVHATGPSFAPSTPSNRGPSFCRRAFTIWRRSAFYYAASCGSLALTIFLGVTLVGIVEGIDYVWIISSALVGLLVLGALVSSAIACWDSIQEENGPSLPTTAP